MKAFKYKTGIICIFLLGTISCSKDIIDLSPRGTVLESNFYKNEAELFQGLVAAYDPLGFATEFTILVDGTNINVSEYGMIDNDGDIGTVSVSKVGLNVNLVVTPNPAVTPITVRFARMGLKA